METSSFDINWSVNNRDEFHEQILAATKHLKFSSLVFVEKDFYVTRLIHALSKIENINYSLHLQGGTCLAKAHKITERMSEDCDFRITMTYCQWRLKPA